MADDPISLWSVVLGGGLTLLGGVLGGGITLLSKMMDVDAEKNRRSAEKFEELVAAVYELEHWLDRKMNVEGFGAEGVEGVAGPAPYAKLEAIPAVYFPEINRALLSALISKAQTYEAWIAAATLKRISGKAADDIMAGYDDMIREYTGARNNLLAELESYARNNIRTPDPILGEQLGRGAPAGLVLEIDERQFLPGAVLHDETRFRFFD